ncbi:MAG: T9SS type A sorting domain-containing protein [Bacteroidia bacterium]|nr:T9SS type A sorting domain-containing protein [Bacteroidia bacterium]
MKHFTLLLSCLLILSAYSSAQNPVPNSGFENWTMMEPNNWLTNNATNVYYTITKDPASAMGMWAAKGEVLAGPTAAIMPVMSSTDDQGNGFAVPSFYTAMSFYYKFVKGGTAEFSASVAFFDGANAVGAGTVTYDVPQSTWTHATIPINDFGQGFLASECIINFLLNDPAPSPIVGDFFMVDEVELTGANSVGEIASTGLEKLFPNPADDQITAYYAVKESGDVEIIVSDMNGKVCLNELIEKESAGRHKIELSTSEMAAGQYTITISSKSGTGSLLMHVYR